MRFPGSLCLLIALSASAQVRTTGGIRGLVIDGSSAAVPNAGITAKDNATGVTATATTREDGAYYIQNLHSGVYELRATASGFQQAVFSRVVVETGTVTDLNVTLNIGPMAETVQVSDVAPVLQTTSNTISTTIRNSYIQDLPLAGRDTMPFALLIPGAQTPGGTSRDSTFNGLPNASLNISIDGINNNSQRFKSGGTSFFGFAPVRLDAIEEVTVSTTGMGADASGGGAMQIRLVTRRGTNQIHGRVFHQFRNDALNANAFFNNARGLARPKVRLNDFGGNLGGPIPLPRTRNRLFFFFNVEATPQPGTQVSAQNLLTESAQRGIFSYIDTAGARRDVNVLQAAAQAGFPGTVDPTIARIFGVINGTRSQGTVLALPTDPIRETLQWRQPTNTSNYYPTVRLDYQIKPALAWHGTWNMRQSNIAGTPNYPGLAVKNGEYEIRTFVLSNSLDWTIRPTLLNNFNFGIQSSAEEFYASNSLRQWADYGNRRIYPGSGVTTIIPDATPLPRNNPVINIYDNLSWVRGKHTITFGGSLLATSFYESWADNIRGGAGVLAYDIGIAAGDPVTAALGQAAFPGIRSSDLAGAWNLYATLTGRLTRVSGARNVNETTYQFEDFTPLIWRQSFRSGGLHAQDSWRVTPRLTLNYGFRWELSGAQRNTNNIYTSPTYEHLLGPSRQLFRPGVLDGVLDPQIFQRSTPYRSDKINSAPNFGFSWNPRGGKTVIRGSYAINYYDEGLNTVQNRTGSNPGLSQRLNLQPGMPGFSPGQLRLTSTLPAVTVSPAAFAFPIPQSAFAFASGLGTTKPELHTPYVQNWTFGIQREIARNTVVEARYVGNKTTYQWRAYSLLETNTLENGFLDEFRRAARNRVLNQSAGVASFANRGLPGQSPLPIFDAAFGARGAQPALPAASGYTNGTFLTLLERGSAGTLADNLAANSVYLCRMVGNPFKPCADLGFNAAGPYPMNFFRMNPFVTSATLLDDNSYSNYHGLQLELRKAYSNGLTLNANYTFSKSLGDLFAVNQSGQDNYSTLRNRGLDKGPAPFDLRHAFQTYWTYELPFGKGRRFAFQNGVLERIAGGWLISGITRINSGRVYQLTGGRTPFNSSDGGVVLRGMSLSELQDRMRSFRDGPSRNLWHADPQLVGPDGRANPAVLAPADTPGEFGQFLFLYGKGLVATDMSLSKTIPITERVKFAFQLEGLNVFNHPVFSIGGLAGSMSLDSTAFGQTSAVLIGARNVQIRAHISW